MSRVPEKVRVDREEYEALAELRDVAHGALLTRHEALKAQYATVCATARDQAHRLSRQDLDVRHAQSEIERLAKENADLKTRCRALEERIQEREPLRSSVDQPLFADVARRR